MGTTVDPRRSRKVLIAGTGRCGTTFLIQLLTRLGLDTGLKQRDDGQWCFDFYQEPHVNKDGMAEFVNRVPPFKWHWSHTPAYIPTANAGCEVHLSKKDEKAETAKLPRYIKNPRLAVMLEDLLREDRIEVDHVLVPVRDLASVGRSKRDLGTRHPHERYYHKTDVDLARDSAIQLGRLAATLVSRDVPFTFVKFPRLVQNWRYAYARLAPVIRQDKMLTERQFKAAFISLADPRMVRFSPAEGDET